jgi:hypothetical protein
VAHFQGRFATAATLIAELDRLGGTAATRRYSRESWTAKPPPRCDPVTSTEPRSCSRAGGRRVRRVAVPAAGEWQAARETIQAALEWARIPPIKWYWFDLYAMTAEVAVALWKARPSGRRRCLRAGSQRHAPS